MHHDLKIFSYYFDAVANGQKKCEIRFNDRNYMEGDTITFFEGNYDDGEFKYTGRNVSANISYVDDFGVQDGYVALSLDNIGMMIV